MANEINFLTLRLLDAIEFASVAHRNQERTGINVPYVSHLFAVALILAKAGYGEDVLIAALLHDTVEDVGVTAAQITERFGAHVAELVAGVTEDKNIPTWEARKAAYLEHLKTASDEAKAISAADLLANQTDVLLELQKNEPLFWWLDPKTSAISIDVRLEHYQKRIDAIRESGVNRELVRELQEVQDNIVKLFK